MATTSRKQEKQAPTPDDKSAVPGPEGQTAAPVDGGRPADAHAGARAAAATIEEPAQSSVSDQADPVAVAEATAPAAAANPPEVDVYPLRTYHDAGELRRRNGPAYRVPRRHADELERRKLASRKKPQE